MQRVAVDHGWRRQDRDPQHVREAVAQRAAPVLIDLGVRDGEHVVRAEARERAVHVRGRWRESLQLVVGGEADALRGRPATEGFADEAARPVASGPAVVRRTGEEERILGPGHRDVGQPPLLRDVAVPVRLRRSGEPLGHP